MSDVDIPQPVPYTPPDPCPYTGVPEVYQEAAAAVMEAMRAYLEAEMHVNSLERYAQALLMTRINLEVDARFAPAEVSPPSIPFRRVMEAAEQADLAQEVQRTADAALQFARMRYQEALRGPNPHLPEKESTL